MQPRPNSDLAPPSLQAANAQSSASGIPGGSFVLVHIVEKETNGDQSSHRGGHLLRKQLLHNQPGSATSLPMVMHPRYICVMHD